MEFEIIRKYKVKRFIKNKLYMYHVPKCAGLSVVKNLGVTLKCLNVLGWSHTYHDEIINNIKYKEDFERKKQTIFPKLPISSNNYSASYFYKLTKNIYSDFPFTYGHIPFMDYINTDNRFTFTVLRDPIKRAKSNYLFWIEKGFIDITESIEKLYEKEILEPNLMTKFFSDYKKPSVKDALKNLKKINIVTNTENISNLMGFLVSHYDLPNMLLTKLNITKKKVLNLENYEDLFIKYNQMDIELMEKSKRFYFDFSLYNSEFENEEYYSIFTENKIFNNKYSLIFKDSDLEFIKEKLLKI